MQEVIPIANTTLNINIAKQLIWRRNAPYFYQTLYTQELEWPSLCVEWWINDNQLKEENSKDEYRLCHLFYGTHTSGEEKNCLMMAKVYLPNQSYLRKYTKDRPQKLTETIRKNDQNMPDKFIIQHQIQHDGQVNRIRHHPKNANLIATRTPLGQIHIFDKTKFGTASKSAKPLKVDPIIILSGHQTEGYSLQWNLHKEGQIIAGSYDGKLSLWDISTRQGDRQIKPIANFNFHNREIEDLSFNQFHDCVFASCDDEGQTVLWDTRNPLEPIFNMRSDSSQLYAVKFSPMDRHIFATGGKDKLVKVWDIRNLSESILEHQQTEEISQLQWSHEQNDQLWSVSGNIISLWDLSEGRKRFIHAGHLEKINQMNLHPLLPMTVASVDSSNDIHVFQPTPNIKK